MSGFLPASGAGRLASRRGVWLLIAIHIAISGVAPTFTSFGGSGYPPSGSPLIAYPLAAAILALQLRHSLAFARGVRLRGAAWSFLALVILVNVPFLLFGWNWIATEVFVMASGAMLFSGWLRFAAVIVPIVGIDIAAANAGLGRPIWVILFAIFYNTEATLFVFVGIYASARVLRLLNELQETKAQLAELAVGQERLRISRDLHDLLGHSLSAVSLKGDLAIRLLHRNPAQAIVEIESLTELAREAQRGIRAVSRNEHAVSLHSEGAAAAALLAAAGVDASVAVDLGDVPPQLERMLAWTVREGVTNALRHSRARRCTISASRRGGNVFLEIVNDGVLNSPGEGTGLTGIAERASALSGTSSYETADGQFRLHVQVPEAVA